MIASLLAFHAVHRVQPSGSRWTTLWWIAALNLTGSVAFQISAMAAFINAEGQVRNLPVANLGTFLGAVGFFVSRVVVAAGAGRPAAPGQLTPREGRPAAAPPA